MQCSHMLINELSCRRERMTLNAAGSCLTLKRAKITVELDGQNNDVVT